MYARRVRLLMLLLSSAFIAFSWINAGQAQKPGAPYEPAIPKTWDEEALAELEAPLADPSHSPKHISADDYYRIPVRPIYKSYPKYHPDKEPPGYREWLRRQEPVVLWDEGARRPKLVTEEDWIKAGEIVFNAPVLFGVQTSSPDELRAFIAKTGDLYDKDGISPFATYVIRERGKLEIGEASCAECHSRVMPDGTVIAGAQSNRPIEQVAYLGLADDAAKAADKEKFLADARQGQRLTFAAPWLRPDPNARFEQFSAAEIEAIHFAIPAGVFARQGTSPFSPAKIPDLIGIKDRRYLDATGFVRHRGIGDLMRYAALNQGMDMLARFGDFIPSGVADVDQSPSVFAQFAAARYSDDQLYAMAMYIYSLKPPPNPNRFDALARRGQKVFQREGCATCHTPPLYTNNKLIPVDGFKAPEDHRKKYDILPLTVGVDPSLALRTRRGTGYYKIPSLKGVWYRGPLEHNGSLATLEDWFDPRRLRDDYTPTGWKGYGVKTRAVKGHEFGMKLSADDKRALIAFLKTL
jgi:Di-haem oxidoreductase, putative peroxidase